MLQFEIRGENVKTTEAIENYIKDKVGKIEKYFDEKDLENAIAHVNYEVHDKETELEVTIPMRHVTLRAEEKNDNLYSAIDLISEKLERQVRKYKTRMNRKSIQDKRPDLDTLFAGATSQGSNNDNNRLFEEEEEIQIVKSKHFNLKPMDEIEAVLQMDLLNHDFFIFTNAENDTTNIVYKRKDGKYGLIEVE